MTQQQQQQATSLLLLLVEVLCLALARGGGSRGSSRIRLALVHPQMLAVLWSVREKMWSRAMCM
jgi:uncharacterized membrane protein